MTSGTLHCGVTSDSLLTKKAYAHLIEPYEVRKRAVEVFLRRVSPSLKVEFFELKDSSGIAATMEDLDACVLTRETEKGGRIINQTRQANGLKPLELVFVDMIMSKT